MKRIAALITATILITSVMTLGAYAGGPYIGYIGVTDGYGFDSPEKTLDNYGYTVMWTDLNLGTNDDDLLMGYKLTNDYNIALKDIIIVDGSNYTSAPSDYHYPPDNVRDIMKDDLNEGAGGEDLYLYASRDPSRGAPIIDLYLKEGTDPPDDSGWEIVTKWGTDGQPADLNEGAGGAYLYLFVKRDYNAAGSIFTQASTWLLIGACVLVVAGTVTAVVIVKKRKKTSKA